MEKNKRYIDRTRVYSGPISQVYSAKDQASGKLVALKIVDVDFVVKPHNIKREIEFLQHQRDTENKGILKYLDSYAFGDDKILVTEFYQINLNQLIEKNVKSSIKYNWNDPSKNQTILRNKFPIDSIGKIFYSLCKTLSYLHDECNIIHRDIKPSNIYFKNEESLDQPILGDFGIIYQLDSPPMDEPLQDKYTDVCTGVYKPPELCLGLTDYGPKIDIWSLGIVISKLYSNDGLECLFDANNRGDLALIDSIFRHFGTPSTTDNSSIELYWPEMKGKSSFEAFEFIPNKRMSAKEMLPRCPENILEVWNNMMIYESSNRSSANDLKVKLEPYCM
ncbi:cyclin-dependent kinase 1 [[Candida] anglica]|uniref:Cyclin-dependent kinase 1 n=1 Tax=[Candida] anglica TaxID=148631 RepID=A0ABP0EMA1_9ASCO